MAGEAAAGETGAETKIESGRGCLEGRVRALERALSAERDARRKLISTLERERKTAAVAEE